MKLIRALPLAILMLPLSAHAQNDYPTIEVVRSVVECMADLGAQNEENLYACTCRHDYIASKMPFKQFENASIQERYSRMPGEKGAVVRDNVKGKEDLKILLETRKAAAKKCPLVRNLEAPTSNRD